MKDYQLMFDEFEIPSEGGISKPREQRPNTFGSNHYPPLIIRVELISKYNQLIKALNTLIN